jgi:hypothetical protein
MTCGTLCMGNQCVTACPQGSQQCGNVCANTQTDPLHCGDCQTACRSNEVCAAGNCRRYGPATGCTSCPCTTCTGDQAQCCTYGANTICVEGGHCPG